MIFARKELLGFAVALFASSSAALAGVEPPLVNWSAPNSSAPGGRSPIRTLGDISNPVPFVAVQPCRQYDTRSPVNPLPQGVNRTVPLTGAPCAILPAAVAVSVNITIFNITGATGNGVFKVDTVSPPTTAWINYPPSEAQRGNAGVVALNSSGQIVVQVAQGAGQVDFVVDVNGYYPSTNVTFRLNNAEYFGVTGLVLGGVIYGENSFAYGVQGVSTATSGSGFGVSGNSHSLSDDSAGVFGYDSTGVQRPLNAYLSAGIRGESFSHNGILGISGFQGVSGSLISGPNEVAYGVLGFKSGVNNYGVFSGGNFGGSGAKFFVEPHPTDASKVIRYVSLEGPEAGTYFRGRGRFVNGVATIEVPEDFRIVTDSEGLSVQVTPIGDFANVAVIRIGLDEIVVKASRNVEFFYTINGVRKSHKDLKPIGPGTEFMPRSADSRIPAYLTETQKAALISNGTYREDGTVNLETAERVGWTAAWTERQARSAASPGPLERESRK